MEEVFLPSRQASFQKSSSVPCSVGPQPSKQHSLKLSIQLSVFISISIRRTTLLETELCSSLTAISHSGNGCIQALPNTAKITVHMDVCLKACSNIIYFSLTLWLVNSTIFINNQLFLIQIYTQVVLKVAERISGLSGKLFTDLLHQRECYHVVECPLFPVRKGEVTLLASSQMGLGHVLMMLYKGVDAKLCSELYYYMQCEEGHSKCS